MALRIERLDLAPWGCFQSHTIHFSSQARVVDLIYGANASGKSTTSRGGRSLLYGIERRTLDSHTFDYSDLRIGGQLILDGKPVELIRRKGRTGTLSDRDGEKLDDDTIARALGGLTQEVYRGLFEISHESLVQGAAELLQGKGEVGASLFAAAAGIAALHDTLSKLDKAAEDVFKPRGRADPLHRTIAELHSAEKRRRDCTLRPNAHRKMARDLGEVEAVCERLSGEIRDKETDVRSLERRRSVSPLLARHTELSEELEQLGDVPELAEDAAQRRIQAEDRRRTGDVQLERSKKAVQDLKRQIGDIQIDAELLEREEEIIALSEQVPVIRKAANDRSKIDRAIADDQAGLSASAATIGVAPDEVEQLRRPAAARVTLDRVLGEHQQLLERFTAASKRLEDAKVQLESDDTALRQAPEPQDPTHLRGALRVAQKLGSIDAQITETDAEQKRLATHADSALRRLRPCPGEMSRLLELTLPSHGWVDKCLDRRSTLEGDAHTLKVERERLVSDTSELDEEREQLQLAGTVPTAEELESARRARQEHWDDVRNALTGGTPRAADLAGSYERAVVEADAVADLRIAGVSQIERAAQLGARTRRLTRAGQSLTERENELKVQRDSLQRAWEREWEASDTEPPDLDDGKEWLESRDEVLDFERRSGDAASRVGVLRAQADSASEALRSRLREGGIDTLGNASLDELRELAEMHIERIDSEAKDRSTLAAAVQRSQADLVAAERECREAREAGSNWREAWPRHRETAGLPAGATPEAAQAIVRAIETALAHLDRLQANERRISGMERDEKEFEDALLGLCAKLAADLKDLGPVQAATELKRRLEATRSQRVELEGLTVRLADAEEELDGVEQELRQADETLGALLAAAGCTEPGELPEVERRAERARTLRQNITQQEQEVADVGEGRFDELAEECREVDRAASAVEIETLRESIGRLAQERETRREQVGDCKRQLTEAEADVRPVQAAEDAELLRVRARDLAITYAKDKLSATIVRRSMERYRKQHEAPMLGRANELFKRFTLKTFTEVFVDHDERDGAILVGREADGRPKRVPEMSSGTREQLFLALRIAAIERYVATSGAVPVIFDDVFLESDEPRSEQIMAALGELAETTQVIVLTHHRHLIELGTRTLNSRLMVHELGDPAVRSATNNGKAA